MKHMSKIHGVFLATPLDITDKYKCLFCAFTTNHLNIINKHHEISHSSNLPVIQYDPNIGYFCSLCQRPMVHFNNLARHISTVHGKKEEEVASIRAGT